MKFLRAFAADREDISPPPTRRPWASRPRLEWRADRISFIRDYRNVHYVCAGTALVLAPPAEAPPR